MKKIVYIAFLILFLSSCSNNKTHKNEKRKDADNRNVISVFGSEKVVSNESLSHQKIKQIIEIANLLQQDIEKDLMKNSLQLAERLYKNKDTQDIQRELLSLKLPLNDSLVVHSYKPISNISINALNHKIEYTFLIDTYSKGKKTTHNKTAIIEFSNIENELEGKFYYSIGSKIIAIY